MKIINFSIRLYCTAILLFLLSHNAHAQSIVAAGYSFTATNKAFTYLSGGTTLSNVQTDDGYDVISIFPFRFCGNTYTDLLICANGWIKFGTVPTYIDPYMNRNNVLTEGQYPCIYPMYEDISGDIGTAKYSITGTAPNRVFVLECRDFKWDYAASSASLSFQVYLYESSGIIEYLYKQESGSVQLNSSGGATIGIANSQTDWLVLDNSGSSPTASSTNYVYNIGTRPATGQSYVFDPGPPCTAPGIPAINLLNSTYIDFSWPPVSGSQGYEYVINQNATGPLVTDVPQFTANTSANKAGLTPATNYYIHLRNKCGTYNYSQWVSRLFTTLTPCVIPAPGIIVSNLDSNSADLSWGGVNTMTEYQYAVRESKVTPVSGDPDIQTTTITGVSLSPLQAGKTYYTYLRVKCQGSDSSQWLIDSFYVPIPCRAPVVQFTDINQSRIVTYWTAPLSAYEYEILASTAPVPNPTVGIKTVHTSYLFSSLSAKTEYYFYARSYCEDRGVKTVSNWYNTSATTMWGVGVPGMDNADGVVRAYPNPAHDVLTVSVPAARGNATITIMDLSGKKMMTVETNSGTETNINVSKLPAGMYVLQYTDQAYNRSIKMYKQ